jgi:hypothetical protein
MKLLIFIIPFFVVLLRCLMVVSILDNIILLLCMLSSK